MEPFVASSSRIPGKYHVVIISTGSVASIKIPLMVEELSKNQDIELQIVATTPSLNFYSKEAVIEAGKGRVKGVWTDEDDWGKWSKVGDPILHIELRRWADLVIVAPCSANTIAKIAGGLCDNLATNLLRALPPTTPLLLFPAMNTQMYLHPITTLHLSTISSLNQAGYDIEVLGPQGSKGLACGDVGVGAMIEWREICGIVEGRGREALGKEKGFEKEGEGEGEKIMTS